jgi:hypothetical protein
MGHTETGEGTSLRNLPDPQLIALWARIRIHYAVTRKDDSCYPAAKDDYEAVLAEYRRRLDGWM